jgi:hypothetical protein
MTDVTQVAISEFDASLTQPAPPHHRHGPSVRNWSRAIGLAGTLCFHALVIQSLGLGLGAHRSRVPEARGLFANQMSSAVAPAEELVLIVLQEGAPHRLDLDQQIASNARKTKPAAISILSPDSLPVSELIGNPGAQENTMTEETVDPAVRAMMLTRYLRQISARVERIWTQPESPLGANGFKCRVQIRQDASGVVQEVLPVECPGSEEWRESLIAAIFQASPLNAPPIPSVFSRALTMTFEAPAQERNAPD